MHCGNKRHLRQNGSDDRKKYCKAFGVVCNKCNKRGHFSSVCQQKARSPYTPKADIQQVVTETIPTAEISNLSSFFAITTPNMTPCNVDNLTTMVQEIRRTCNNDTSATSCPQLDKWMASKSAPPKPLH